MGQEYDANYSALNWTSEEAEEEEEGSEADMFPMHPAWIAFQCVFFVAVGGLGVFGNCVALLALATTPRLRNTCTALIGNLCVADLLSSTQLLVLMTPTLLMRGFPDNMALCKAVLFLPTAAYSVALTTLLFIAANRYLLITRSRRCHSRCCGRAPTAASIAFIWLVNFVVVALPALSGTRPVAYDPEGPGCVADTDWTFSTVMLSLYVVLPGFVLVPLLYGLTVYAARASHRRVHAHRLAGASNADRSAAAVQSAAGPGVAQLAAVQSPVEAEHHDVSSVSASVTDCDSSGPEQQQHQQQRGQQKPVSKRELKFTRLPILIFAVVAVCWTPQLVVHVVRRFVPVSVYFRKSASLFILANASINPYLYAWSNRNFRQAYKRILGSLKIRP